MKTDKECLLLIKTVPSCLVVLLADTGADLHHMHMTKQAIQVLLSILQTLLFSATMPSALHEFAKAGLKEPEMVRLDTDTRISQDLATAFFTVRSATECFWFV